MRNCLSRGPICSSRQVKKNEASRQQYLTAKHRKQSKDTEIFRQDDLGAQSNWVSEMLSVNDIMSYIGV